MKRPTKKAPARKRARHSRNPPKGSANVDAEADDDPRPKPADAIPDLKKAFDPDLGIAFAKRMLNWLMTTMEKDPASDPSTAAARARDSRTLSEMSRTLEKLDALERRRLKHRKKMNASDHADLRKDFVRRMDQLLATGAKAAGAGKPDEK